MPPNNGQIIETIPCRVTLTAAPHSLAQFQAWQCLWRLLLAEEGAHTGSSASGSEGEQNDQT